MNANPTNRRTPIRFGRETRFKVRPSTGSARRDHSRNVFEQLKTRLLHPVLSQTPDRQTRHQLRLAANEAAAIAWMTGFPHLVLPLLFEEKTAEVQQYLLRQEQVQNATFGFAHAE